MHVNFWLASKISSWAVFNSSLTFPLTERVIVKRQGDGTLDISFPDEPQYETATEPKPFKMIDHKTGEVLAEWMSAPPEKHYFGP